MRVVHINTARRYVLMFGGYINRISAFEYTKGELMNKGELVALIDWK